MSEHSQPTRAPHLAEQVARQLTRSIHAGEWRQGQRLPTEAALGERFGISRPVVREAISMLRNAGLVMSRRGSGSFVTESPTVTLHMPLPSASLSSVIRLLELRRALEVEAARLAAIRRTPAQLRRIRNAVVEIDEAVEAGDTGVDQDMAFHRSIAEACGNEHFTAVIDFHNRFLHHAITLTRTNEARRTVFMTQVMAEHDDIVTAIGRSDPDAAAQAVSRHLDNAEWRLSQAPADLLEQAGFASSPTSDQ
ncbi:FadR/GntR family transcriptional regulator [Kushneria phosphatilytica]|uniref:FadR family transcriptional regulator n=1 Tax=Kushneria phosphatilytica TaxID=657387 RepID=A0A1S1P220_9GAMM|nr:FadR/GntR family transcriptional regulator [Kushneria phosphatilytica]OHV12840.1 GntR family transcriptional regulator [Kushneria phosphatilytica]QEL10689.1 FadR family transcriptional regulator [Kushneria phosphatilytica]